MQPWDFILRESPASNHSRFFGRAVPPVMNEEPACSISSLAQGDTLTFTYRDAANVQAYVIQLHRVRQAK
jgi:hypothetical protein